MWGRGYGIWDMGYGIWRWRCGWEREAIACDLDGCVGVRGWGGVAHGIRVRAGMASATLAEAAKEGRLRMLHFMG